MTPDDDLAWGATLSAADVRYMEWSERSAVFAASDTALPFDAVSYPDEPLAHARADFKFAMA